MDNPEKKPPETAGEIIVSAVIRAAALDYAIQEGDATIFVWRANAYEQIEAALQEAGCKLVPI